MKRAKGLRSNDIVYSLVWAMASGLAAAMLAMFVCAFILTKLDMPEQTAVTMGTVCIALAAAVAGFVGAAIHKSQGMVIGALSGLAVYLPLLLISIFVSGTQFTSATPIRLLLSVALAAVAGIVAVNVFSKRKMI